MSIANHNPGNIRATDEFVWRGQIGVTRDGYVVFRSPLYGLRAIARVWMTYEREHHLHTLREYLTRWAPPAENDTEAYIHAVARDVGLNPEVDLNIHLHAAELMKAVIRHENGQQPYDDDLITQAIAMSHIV